MIVRTASGSERIDKRSRYGKWLLGWIDGNGWTGAGTVTHAWLYACETGKPSGCGWYAYGYLMAREQQRGRQLEAREWKELL